MLFVVHANLLGLKILAGNNVEFVGFLGFVACLGYVSAYRTFANEERLLAINKELEIASPDSVLHASAIRPNPRRTTKLLRATRP